MVPEGEVYSSVDQYVGPLLDARELAASLAEPVLESAPVAFETAMERCHHDSACQAYHAVWQYLRLADMVRSVQVDGPIYVAVAERLARVGRLNRVLITATADYAMLAHLAHGARLAGVNPDFDVLDRCATALYLNKWYGARNGLKVRSIEADVLEYDGSEEYDLICTHSLLTVLPPSHRPRLFQQWRGHLREYGRICFSNRVWDNHMRLTPQELDRRVAAMAATATRKLQERGLKLPCPVDRFSSLVRRYGERYGVNHNDLPPLPLAAIEGWAAEAGLAVEVAIPANTVVTDGQDKAPGPFPTERGPRMWFQLRRA